MLTFEQFLHSTAEEGDAVNLVFEQRLFDLVGVLHKIAGPLAAGHVPHELVGGLAVLIHVEEADPAHSMLTRDVDLMIRRSGIARVIGIAEGCGFKFRHAADPPARAARLDMLLHGDSAKTPIQWLFSGEKVRPAQATSNPDIRPVQKAIHGESVAVISLADLLRMKLSSWRLKDHVHIQVMDAAGLITTEVESTLSEELRGRLRYVRETD
jgi:hypothetical protein